MMGNYYDKKLGNIYEKAKKEAKTRKKELKEKKRQLNDLKDLDSTLPIEYVSEIDGYSFESTDSGRNNKVNIEECIKQIEDELDLIIFKKADTLLKEEKIDNDTIGVYISEYKESFSNFFGKLHSIISLILLVAIPILGFLITNTLYFIDTQGSYVESRKLDNNIAAIDKVWNEKKITKITNDNIEDYEKELNQAVEKYESNVITLHKLNGQLLRLEIGLGVYLLVAIIIIMLPLISDFIYFKRRTVMFYRNYIYVHKLFNTGENS